MIEEQIRKGFSALGLYLELTRSDPVDVLGLPVYRVELSDIAKSTGFGGMRFWGKGLNSEKSRHGALAEAVERYCAYEHSGAPRIQASFGELGKAALDPRRLLPIAPELIPPEKRPRYRLENPIDWVEGQNYRTGESVYVPAASVYLYPPGKDGLISATSSGLAAGTSEPAAVLHALCEIVERDATMILMRNRMVRQCIESPEALGAVVERLRKQGFKVILRDITTDIQIPSVVALICDEKKRFPSLTFGFGTHPNQEVACIRAVTEAAQSRVVEIYHRRKYGVRQFAHGELQTIFSHLLVDVPKRPLVATSPRGGDNLDELIETCLTKILEIIPDTALYILRLTRPEFSIPTFRVVVPGLVPPQANYPFVLPRLLKMPHTLGYSDRDVLAHELWQGTWPH